jgi:enolase-phosphatase E1
LLRAQLRIVNSRGVLLDVEGTTTPISFVYNVLFPYARRHVHEYLREADLQELQREHAQDLKLGNNPPAWSPHPVSYVLWLMDQDRKSTALKAIQGKIWLEGYKNGQLRGEVFADVPPALERWAKTGSDVRIYSSGSILAQQLLFSTTAAGDLTRFLKGYFDTTTGPKHDLESYRAIAQGFRIAPSEITFISDVTAELAAARLAGMDTALCIRPGNPIQSAHDYRVITTFENF